MADARAVMSRAPAWSVAVALTAALQLAGCQWPRDSAGTLDRVRGGGLRVGVTHTPPWIAVDRDRVSGLEVELVEAWAAALGARVIWRHDTESDLVEALHRRELDVLAAGLRDDTSFRTRIALTRPYLELEGAHGTERHVLAVMPGESALLLSLDRFLAERDRDALRVRATVLSP